MRALEDVMYTRLRGDEPIDIWIDESVRLPLFWSSYMTYIGTRPLFLVTAGFCVLHH